MEDQRGEFINSSAPFQLLELPNELLVMIALYDPQVWCNMCLLADKRLASGLISKVFQEKAKETFSTKVIKTDRRRLEWYVLPDGNYHGTYKSWYENGQIAVECNFQDGNRHGPYKCWYENGRIETECNYQDNKFHGPYKCWYGNGQLEREYNYKDDKLHGPYKSWYENGQVMVYEWSNIGRT